MSKRNIAYIKPQDPSFLAKFKAEAGYKEGPTVDTKRQKLDGHSCDSDSAEDGADRPERDDEQPQVVTLQPGDLTKEEAEQEQRRIAREEAEAPADLKKRIIFKKKAKANLKHSEDIKRDSATSGKKKKNILQSCSSKLSFSQHDDDEDDDQ